MDDLISFFEAYLNAEEKRPDTIEQYGSFLRRFDRFLGEEYQLGLDREKVGGVTGFHLSAYLQQMVSQNRAVSTRNNYVVILKLFFQYLKAIEVIDHDPSQVLHCVKEKQTPETQEKQSSKRYTNEEIALLIDALACDKPKRNDLRDAAVVALILGSGLRAFEVCALNVSQFEEIKRGELYCLRKGGNWAHISVADYVAPCVECYLKTRDDLTPDAPMFVSQKGERLDRKTLWKSLAAKQSRLNLKTGVHIFRHTLLTAIDQSGGSAMARDIGGHSSVYITNRYVHTSVQERRQAICSTPYAETMKKASGQ